MKLNSFFLVFLTVIVFSVPRLSAAAQSLELSDLGFTKGDTQADLRLSEELKTRSSMLKTHQTMGLITGGLMAVTLLAAESAEKQGNYLHPILGGLTYASYMTTAYFSLTAPKPTSAKDGTNVKIHKALAWVHFPMMVLMPVTGIVAKRQIEKGEEPHGLGKIKGTVGSLAALTFYPAMLTMFFEF